MRGLFIAVLAAATLGAADGLSLRAAPRNSTAAIAIEHATPKDVEAEKAKIAHLAQGLSAMLGSQAGALSKSKVAPALKLFLNNLQAVLKDVNKTTAPAEAMRKLVAAKAGVAGLVSELSSQQESLMKEDSSQRESLLLGVLLTRQKEPMDRQLEVLHSKDFAGLDVARALLSNHSAGSALYVQAAAYLDSHRAAGAKAAGKLDQRIVRVDAMASSLDKRVEALQREADTRARHHDKKVEELQNLIKKASSGKTQRVLKVTLKREEHDYKKWVALRRHDIDSMKAASEAVRSGDVKALERAKNALEKSLEALKGRSSGFLVLLAMGHRLLDQDCPYCAAQCVEACHNRGEPYVGCLSECADAGKGF